MKTNFNYKTMSLAIACMLLLPTVSGYAAETTRVSLNDANIQGGQASVTASVSADGSLVAFASDAANLVPGDTNGVRDVFVRNRITGKTTRVSVSSANVQGNFASSSPKISADGVYVAFVSDANNLVFGDINGKKDVFLRNLLTGKTTLVSIGTSGTLGNDHSQAPSISANGQFIAFDSYASNLVPGDTNGLRDVFVHNRLNGSTTRVSVNSAGVQGNLRSDSPAISAAGDIIAFSSKASNLVPPGVDSNGVADIFVHNRINKQTTRVSISSTGQQGSGASFLPAISADGIIVAFATNSALVANDTNLRTDVYVRDRLAGKTTRVSVDSNGVQGNLSSTAPALSADGLLVGFESFSNNLVPGDTNADKDIFVHNRQTAKTNRVSVDTLATEADNDSFFAAVSAEGRLVAFQSLATNLVPNDTNAVSDIFMHDRLLLQTQEADVQLAVTTKPDSVKAGAIASYTFTITNKGPDIAGNVILSDVISNGNVVTLTPSQGTCSRAAVSVCRFGGLAVNASATLKVDIRAVANPLVQRLNVGASPVDSVPVNNRVVLSTPVTP